MIILRNTIENIKLFSKKTLPEDWDEDDDAYVEMVEKAKKRNKRIAKVGPYISPIGYGTVGAALGGVAGGPKSAALGAVAGVGGSLVGRQISKKILGKKYRSFEDLSNSDQKAADRALGHYRNMKTKEERVAWRKKIGSKV